MFNYQDHDKMISHTEMLLHKARKTSGVSYRVRNSGQNDQVQWISDGIFQHALHKNATYRQVKSCAETEDLLILTFTNEDVFQIISKGLSLATKHACCAQPDHCFHGHKETGQDSEGLPVWLIRIKLSLPLSVWMFSRLQRQGRGVTRSSNSRTYLGQFQKASKNQFTRRALTVRPLPVTSFTLQVIKRKLCQYRRSTYYHLQCYKRKVAQVL